MVKVRGWVKKWLNPSVEDLEKQKKKEKLKAEIRKYKEENKKTNMPGANIFSFKQTGNGEIKKTFLDKITE